MEVFQCCDCDEVGVDEAHLCHPVKFYNVQRRKDLRFSVALEKVFSQKTMAEIIGKIFQEKIDYAEKKVEEVFFEYSSLAKKGIPFKERIAMVDTKKVEWLRKYIEKLKSDSSRFKVIPFSEWIQASDYEKIKKYGFNNFVKFWFDLTYQINK